MVEKEFNFASVTMEKTLSISAPDCFPLSELSPEQALLCLQDLSAVTFLDSSGNQAGMGRYSFLMADPFATLIYNKDGLFWNDQLVQENPWSFFKEKWHAYTFEGPEDGPPFRGGAAGAIDYEMNHTLDLPGPPPEDDWDIPYMQIHFYDLVVVFDHLEDSANLYSSGFPETDQLARSEKAKRRATEWIKRFSRQASLPEENESLASGWRSNFTVETFEQAVDKVRAYIRAGDIFQANIAQCFTTDLPPDFKALSYYIKLRTINPAPFSAYLQYEGYTVASASPERFIAVANGQVETRPIKGTRPRSQNMAEDQSLAGALQTSAKDLAENTMIVDLLRNDLSKVCVPGSVKVPVLCGLESYANVHHLVSIVQGTLDADFDAVDALRHAFPGGSITGAPKKRSMEIIRELEKIPRHLYCGSIGYWGFDGRMDTNIAIRTVLFKPGKTRFQVGGGITWLSDPAEEYAETLTKAQRLFKSFEV
jgi:para-aminobenzoate synthetase component I